MILARANLGRQVEGNSQTRRPPDGFHSCMLRGVAGQRGGGDIYAVYDNDQAYPEYVVFYDQNAR